MATEKQLKYWESLKGKCISPQTTFKKGEHRSLSTEFKKGLIPWNKGINYKLSSKAKEAIRLAVKKQWDNGERTLIKQFTNKGNRHTQEAKDRISEAHKLLTGEKNWRWIKDRTQLKKSEKKHLDGQYRDWMFGVKKRDNWKCKIADESCKGRLEAHHILNWKEYPELRYKINNGITLCHAHHPRGRKSEAKLSPFFQELVKEI